MSIHQPTSQRSTLEDASNSGSLDDLITSHNKPMLVGTAEADAIHIYVDEKIVANISISEDGTGPISLIMR